MYIPMMILSKGLVRRSCRCPTMAFTSTFCASYLSKLDPQASEVWGVAINYSLLSRSSINIAHSFIILILVGISCALL